jgi:hypothetical protein
MDAVSDMFEHAGWVHGIRNRLGTDWAGCNGGGDCPAGQILDSRELCVCDGIPVACSCMSGKLICGGKGGKGRALARQTFPVLGRAMFPVDVGPPSLPSNVQHAGFSTGSKRARVRGQVFGEVLSLEWCLSASLPRSDELQRTSTELVR